MRYVEPQLTGFLVGDTGYPCLPFLLTPIASPSTDAELTYNIIHGKMRRIVERTFGGNVDFPVYPKDLQIN